MNTTRHTGQLAEKKALDYLTSKGLHLLKANYHCIFGEIDLIMRDTTWLVFIEVRFRRRTDYGHAAATVSRTKQNRIIKTAKHFLRWRPKYADWPIRFDVIGVYPSCQFDWIQQAFTAGW